MNNKDKIIDFVLDMIAPLFIPILLFSLMIGGIWYQTKVWHDTNDMCEPICQNSLNPNQTLSTYNKLSFDTQDKECVCEIRECLNIDCNKFEMKTLHVK